MAGLATAWFLQDGGAQVTVYERDRVAAGASWGNAGWLSPGFVAPLPEPAVLRYGAARRGQPAVAGVPAAARRPEPAAVPRVVRPAQHAGAVAARDGRLRSVAATVPSRPSTTSAGVCRRTHPPSRSWPATGTNGRPAGCCTSWHGIRAAGHDVSGEQLTGDQARSLAPNLTAEVGAAIRVRGQRYLDPPAYVRALAESVARAGRRAAGGRRGARASTRDARRRRGGPRSGTTPSSSPPVPGSAGWRGGSASGRSCRPAAATASACRSRRCRPGRCTSRPQRVACTPLGDRLRVAGMMEFRRPEEPLDPRRIAAITDAVRPFLAGVDLDDRQDEWVGSRPCTADGLPLLGRTASPRVFVSGGHGMWGIALGPVTGRLRGADRARGRDAAGAAPVRPAPVGTAGPA